MKSSFIYSKKHLRSFDKEGRGAQCAIVFLLFFIAEPIAYAGSANTYAKQAKECQSFDEYGQPVAGQCVKFYLCPRLLEFVKQPRKTIDDFRLLKTLTCGIHKNEPLICCPEGEVELPPRRDDNAPKLTMTFPGETSPNEAYSIADNEPLQARSPDISDILYASEPRRYGLIPSIEDCGEPRFDLTGSRIIGGQAAERGQFPYMALLYRIDTNTDEEEYYCAGTILNQFYILTAAHCIFTNIHSAHELAYVQVGITDVNQRCYQSNQSECASVRRYEIKDKIAHPKYTYGTRDRSHDIALLRTAKPIMLDGRYTRPVCLPLGGTYGLSIESMVGKAGNDDLESSTSSGSLETEGFGIVAGWGRESSTGGQSSGILKHAVLPIIPSRDCQKLYSAQASISATHQVCAGGEHGKDTCVGDSGGPLLNSFKPSTNSSSFYDKKLVGKMFQTGIVSFGPAICGLSGKPSVYTKILPYIDWILDNMYL